MTNTDNQVLIDRLADAARDGKISRRSFMNYSMAAGMTASAATGLWGTIGRRTAEPRRHVPLGVHDGNSSDTHDPGTYVTRQMIFLAHTFAAI